VKPRRAKVCGGPWETTAEKDCSACTLTRQTRQGVCERIDIVKKHNIQRKCLATKIRFADLIKRGAVHNNAGVTIRTARDTTAANISSAAFPPTSSRPILEPISNAIVVNCRCLSCRGGHGSSSLHDADARSCKHNNVCWSPELRGACRLGHHIDPRVDTQRRYGARAHAGSRLSFSNCIGYCLLS